MNVLRTVIKDTYLKLLFIPLIGLAIPLLANLNNDHASGMLLISAALFIFSSHLIWNGAIQIVNWCRTHRPNLEFTWRLIVVSLSCGTFGAVVTALSAFLWLQYSSGIIVWSSILMSSSIAFFTTMFIGMLYELIFLKKDHEVKSKIVQCLDRDLAQAEMAVLQYHLEPHFIFNALTSLHYLVKDDAEKAQAYIRSLSSVYRYLLANREREMVTLDEELRFIDSYIFMLRIRYENSVIIDYRLSSAVRKWNIVPFALQILVENAIKHNAFSASRPLLIRIFEDANCIVVENKLYPRQELPDSTKVGLEHLMARYRLHGAPKIEVRKDQRIFSVRIPAIKTI